MDFSRKVNQLYGSASIRSIDARSGSEAVTSASRRIAYAVSMNRSGWYDCDSTLGTQALVRLGGDPEQIAHSLARIRDEERAQRVLESDQPASF